MRTINKAFHCPKCNTSFEAVVLEAAMTAACPNCRPVVALLERLGLTPGEAVALTLLTLTVVHIARN